MENQNTSESDGKVRQKKGMFRRLLGWYWAQHDGKSGGEPVKRTLAAFILLAIGVAGSEAYGYVRDTFRDPDAYLVQMKQDQDTAFKQLQDSLQTLSSSLDGEGRQALKDVRGAVGEMKAANTGLLAQLDLAKEENIRLSQVAGRQAGVSGGYDFILSEHTGLALDAASVIGVNSISYGANVRVSAAGVTDQSEFMEAGESIAYKNAQGRECRVILLSVVEDRSASFKNSCG